MWDLLETPTGLTGLADEYSSTDPSCYQGVQSNPLAMAVDLLDRRVLAGSKRIDSQSLH